MLFRSRAACRLNRGGTLGQQGELEPRPEKGQQQDKNRQQGGLNREPNLEKDKKNQQPPTSSTNVGDSGTRYLSPTHVQNLQMGFSGHPAHLRESLREAQVPLMPRCDSAKS